MHFAAEERPSSAPEAQSRIGSDGEIEHPNLGSEYAAEIK